MISSMKLANVHFYQAVKIGAHTVNYLTIEGTHSTQYHMGLELEWVPALHVVRVTTNILKRGILVPLTNVMEMETLDPLPRAVPAIVSGSGKAERTERAPKAVAAPSSVNQGGKGET